jgi:aldehyde dehydrogenase (NAD+)
LDAAQRRHACARTDRPAGLITPWNWPINQIALKVLPALATGCPAILKPSEHTPLSAQIYAEILHDAGVPSGAFALIHGTGPEVGDALARHPGLAMVSFTGSTRAGISVTKAAADSVKRVTLELGGKSPNLVFADCGDRNWRPACAPPWPSVSSTPASPATRRPG